MTSMRTDAIDEVRLRARKIAALARAAENILDDVVATDDDSRAKLEDLAHLLGATAEAADATCEAGNELERRVVKPRDGQDV